MKMTNVIVNEKGNVKAGARKAITEYVASHREVFAEAVANENGTYSLAVVDGAGNTVYVNFDITVFPTSSNFTMSNNAPLTLILFN